MRSLSGVLPSFLAASMFLSVVGGGSARADYPVFDLVANRPLAHLQRQGGLAIAGGSTAMARYIHFSHLTWKLNQLEDGHKVALASTQVVLEVPLTSEQAKRGGLVIVMKGAPKQTVRASVDGKGGAAVPVGTTFAPVSIPLPDGAFSAGENRISLTFANSGSLGGQKAAAAIEHNFVGAGSTMTDTPLVAGSDKGLTIPANGGITYYAFVPEGGALATSGDAAGCTLKVSATNKGKHAEGALTPGTPFDLSSLAGEIVRLDISASGSCKEATLTSAALTKKGVAPKVELPSRPRNVIFWMTDSTRADKYKVFNSKTRVETDVMSALAKKATLFSAAYTQGNESRVSHASQWTGTYPSVHKFIPANAVLSDSWITFPKIAKAAGEFVDGLMGNGFIKARWGFGGGFDHLENHIETGGGLKAEDFVKDATSFFAQHDKNPFFLYIGTIDCHVSWRAHEPWISKYDEPGYTGRFVKALIDPDLDKIVAGKLAINDRDKVRIKALYDGDVSYNDHWFGELLKVLEQRGHTADTMVILSADHGDEFWEHGKVGHGQSLHEELIHTPLAIYYPPLFPARMVTEGVETIDLLPTIADALGQKIPDTAQGESLIPIAQGVGVGYPRPGTSSQYELSHSMRLARYKLWVGGGGNTVFYDAVNDNVAETDLSKDKPVEKRFLTDAMGLWMAYQPRWKKSKWGVASNLKAGFADELDK